MVNISEKGTTQTWQLTAFFVTHSYKGETKFVVHRIDIVVHRIDIKFRRVSSE